MILHAAFFINYTPEAESQSHGNVGHWGKISVQMVTKICVKGGHLGCSETMISKEYLSKFLDLGVLKYWI